MEILFEEVLWLDFAGGFIFFSGVLIFMGILAFLSFRDYVKTKDRAHLFFGYFAVFLLLITLSACLLLGKLPKQVIAKVTSIDEVYDNGYEIIDRKGENYIIRER